MTARSTNHQPSGKERLLDAAEALFASNGYFGASMRDIALAAGTTVGNMTHHFASKDELFRETMMRRAPVLKADMERSFQNAAGRGVEAILESYSQVLMDWRNSDDPAQRAYLRLAILIMMQPVRPDIIDPVYEIYRDFFATMRSALAKELPNLSGTTLSSALTGFTSSLFNICVNIYYDGNYQYEDGNRTAATLVTITALGLRALNDLAAPEQIDA